MFESCPIKYLKPSPLLFTPEYFASPKFTLFLALYEIETDKPKAFL